MSTESTELALEENDTLTQFQALGLDMRALNAVTRLALNAPTDVQREAIPPFIRGRDVVATAPTGTG
ncbi:MAG: ATP-dependent helicase, partial [Alphaproteobacteria bacterium]|nr:ATP-dependent helicase [Alphaproteobacteria bacterium]